jgi:hypothetical protein
MTQYNILFKNNRKHKNESGERMKKQNKTRRISISRMLHAERVNAGISSEPRETGADEARSPDTVLRQDEPPAPIRKYRFRIGADGHTRLPGDDSGDFSELQTEHCANWPFEGICISVEGATMPIERIGKEGRRSEKW